jgi:2-octaprenylphenol hydroxylase
MNAAQRVAVSGAGPAGLTLALLLARAGVPVTVLGASPPPAESAPDLRAYSLNRASERLLRAAGAWPLLPSAYCQPMRRMVVWEGGSGGQFELHAAELGVPHLAHIVPHPALLAALWQTAQATPGLELLPARLRDWQEHAVGWTLHLHDGQTREAALLAAADGASSWLRERLRVPSLRWDYGHTAVTGVVHCERAHEATGWQRFLPQGPVALLPLADGACSCIWSTHPGHVEELAAMNAAAFGAALTEATEGVLGAISAQGPRQAFALRAALVRDYSAGRCVFLGDAAHRIHPLAGQGLNQGLKDVADLCQIVLAAAAKGHDLGGARACHAYGRARLADNTLMLAGMEGLKRAFAWQASPLRALRRFGLTQVNHNGIFKAMMAAVAGST